MRRLDGREQDEFTHDAVSRVVSDLLGNEPFVDAISGSTGGVEAVNTRINAAAEAFATI